MTKIITLDDTEHDDTDDLTPEQTLANEKELGQLAYNRLTILAAIKVEVHQDRLKEQLREIEKQMVVLGWNGKAHIVLMTGDGLKVKSAPKTKGIVIQVKPLSMSAHINKYR